MIKVFEITRSGDPVDFVVAEALAEKIGGHIREVMSGGIFKAPTGRLKDSITAYAVGNYVYVASHLEYAKHQNEGVKSHVMWYLLGATIPIRTQTGQVVYRKATLRSFLNGSWRHPGYPGKQFVEKGVARTQMESPDVNISSVGGPQ